MRYSIDVLPSLLVVLGAVMIGYANLTMAQKDIADLKEGEEKHEEILAEIGPMAENIENMETALVNIGQALRAINETLKADAIEDAKHHHRHPGNGR